MIRAQHTDINTVRIALAAALMMRREVVAAALITEIEALLVLPG